MFKPCTNVGTKEISTQYEQCCSLSWFQTSSSCMLSTVQARSLHKSSLTFTLSNFHPTRSRPIERPHTLPTSRRPVARPTPTRPASRADKPLNTNAAAEGIRYQKFEVFKWQHFLAWCICLTLCIEIFTYIDKWFLLILILIFIIIFMSTTYSHIYTHNSII